MGHSCLPCFHSALTVPTSQVLAFVYNKKIVARLFDEAPARYADRNGGFCRVLPVVPDKDGMRRYRRGDNTEMAIIELV